MPAIRIRVAPLLYSYTGGMKTVEVESDTVGGAILALDRRFPGVAFRVIDEQNQVRPHVNIFLGETNIRNLATPLDAGSEIFIVGALSGG